MSVGLYVAMRISTLFSLEGEWKPATDKDIKPTLLSIIIQLLLQSSSKLIPPTQEELSCTFSKHRLSHSLRPSHPCASAISPSTVVSFIRDCASYNTQHFTLNSLVVLWMTEEPTGIGKEIAA
eukprot:scaffold12377_cov74-Skeletonema_dohrnii-CCMP3373.AAC.3